MKIRHYFDSYTNEFTFGRFKGKSIYEVAKKSPGYIDWCILNLYGFVISDEEILELKKLNPLFFVSEEEGPVELPEAARLRDRTRKERDRERDRGREHRERYRLHSRSKRRRGERLIMVHDGGDDSSEESVNDDEEYDDVKMLPPPASNNISPASFSSSLSNHHQRKNFPPPPSKTFRSPPSPAPVSEMIGVSVPRKARSGREVETTIESSSLSLADQISFHCLSNIFFHSLYKETT